MTEETKTTGLQENFISHLIELRDRLLKIVVGVVGVCGLLMVWPGPAAIYNFLARPMVAALPDGVLPGGAKMIATGIISGFMVPMKVTLLASFIVALPWVLYQIWAFVAPGLYAHEKKLVAPLVISSSLLFLIGVAFCYFIVFGKVFAFIAAFSPSSIAVIPDIENYFDFVMTMCLAFGVTFEVPIVVIVLVRMGLVSVEKLKEIRRYVIVGAFVIAAIVTPPDIASQFFLAIPLCLLYELGILVAPLFVRATQAPQEDVN